MNVVTLGTFDLFHVGHVRLLERADMLGRVTVGLNTDEFVTRYKGRPPVIRYNDRAEVLRACRYVAEVVPNDQRPSAAALILAAGADVIVVGDDWQGRDYMGQLGLEAGWPERVGIEIVYLPRTPGVSTTQIRALVA